MLHRDKTNSTAKSVWMEIIQYLCFLSQVFVFLFLLKHAWLRFEAKTTRQRLKSEETGFAPVDLWDHCACVCGAPVSSQGFSMTHRHSQARLSISTANEDEALDTNVCMHASNPKRRPLTPRCSNTENLEEDKKEPWHKHEQTTVAHACAWENK